MSEMFPCEQRAVTQEYRDNFEDIFSKSEVVELDDKVQIELPLEEDNGIKRK